MASVGWIGLGKLGLPCALVLADCGHSVVGYDVVGCPAIIGDVLPPQEDGIHDLMASVSIQVVPTLPEVIHLSDVVFVAVQTPHAPAYGGETAMPAECRDFEYGFLIQAVRDVAAAARAQRKLVTVVVVSTALPGMFNRHLRQLINPYVTLVYNPFFIAMGTTIRDMREPEFVLVGVDNEDDAIPLRAIYAQLHSRPLFVTTIESAELIKVSYNTFISMKIVFANMVMELCHKTGADCDQVADALSLATERVVSPAYLRGGMGDGGHCHPRDLIAMSWLARRLDLSVDLMGFIAHTREDQTAWLADLVSEWASLTNLPIVLLGKSYKPESDLMGGSPALLLAEILRDRGLSFYHRDPHTGDIELLHMEDVPSVYVITTRHSFFSGYVFAKGSVVLDPFGYIPDSPGVTVIRIGRKT